MHKIDRERGKIDKVNIFSESQVLAVLRRYNSSEDDEFYRIVDINLKRDS